MLPLPIPPIELRRAIGDASFDNPTGALVYHEVPAAAYEREFDFGCGYGRLARQMMQQREARPRSCLGIDLNKAAVEWASANLGALDGNSLGFHSYPRGRRRVLYAGSGTVLAEGGYFVSTWFLFDKRFFSMMQEFQNSLYIQVADPTNAVIYDREFVKTLFRAAGLTVIRALPPGLRGFQWKLVAVPSTASVGQTEAEFPDDDAPFGLARPADISGTKPDQCFGV